MLRRGVFWYYLQDSDLRPVLEAESEHTCAPIYQADRRTLLFRVVHHRRRVSLEVFHALSDGTGALWFLSALLEDYCRRRDGLDGAAQERAARRRAMQERAAHAEEFSREAASAVLRLEDEDPELTDPLDGVAEPAPAAPPAPRRVLRLRGTRTPDHRTRVLELTMPAAPVLALAKGEGVALSMYLTALFFEAIRRTGALERDARGARTLAASVPVNLRRFFPSDSARNFFATITVSHTYGAGADGLGEVARELQEAFSAEATEEALEEKLRRLLRVERSPLARIVPRPLKDLLLGLVNRANNRSLTVAISNLGRVTLPEAAAAHVGRMAFHVSAARPQFCAISHDGLLTISFTSPFVETAHVREFARALTEAGIEVSLAASRTTEEELAEVGR